MIEIKTRGIPQLTQFFHDLPAALRKLIVPTVSEYLIGDANHGLKHLVGYRYVSRKIAYGKTWFSERQRRYMMAKIRSGEIKIPYQRTGATSAGWQYKLTGGGYGSKIYNDTQGAKYAQGDTTQSRHEAKVGHRKVTDVLVTNIKGAIQRAEQAIQRWINSHGG